MPSPLKSTAHPIPHPELLPKLDELADVLVAKLSIASERRITEAKARIAGCAGALRGIIAEVSAARETLKCTDADSPAELTSPPDLQRFTPGDALAIDGTVFLTDEEGNLEDELFALCDEELADQFCGPEDNLVRLALKLEEIATRDEGAALRRKLARVLGERHEAILLPRLVNPIDA